MTEILTPQDLNEMRNWYPRAEQLVRLGMLPVGQLPYIKRALTSIESDAYLPLILRKPFYRFIEEVMELALGEPGIFRLIRNKVAANRNNSVINRYMPEEVHMDEHEELVEGNAENKAKKREYDMRLAKNVAARRDYMDGGDENPVKTGRMIRRVLKSKSLSKVNKGEEWTRAGNTLVTGKREPVKEEKKPDFTYLSRYLGAGLLDGMGERDAHKAVRDSRKAKAKAPKPAPKVNEETLVEGNAENKAKKNKVAKNIGTDINTNFGIANYGGPKGANIRTGRAAMRNTSKRFLDHALGRDVKEGLFDSIRAKDIKLSEVGKKKAEIPKPVPGRVKMGTRDGKTPMYTMMQDGSMKKRNEELELINLNLLDEDVDYRKTPQGMLQTLSSMVKIKKRHGGKVSVNDRKIASKARNELRRRKYFGAGQTLSASFDTAYLDLADDLVEQGVFVTDEQLDVIEEAVTEELMNEVSDELKVRYAEKVEKNFKEKGVRAKGRKQYDKVTNRLKRADAILKNHRKPLPEETESPKSKEYIAFYKAANPSEATQRRERTPAQMEKRQARVVKLKAKLEASRQKSVKESAEPLDELKKVLPSYVKKALVQKSDADFNLGIHRDKRNENQHYPIHSDEKSQGGLGNRASVNQLLRTSERRGKGIQTAVKKLAAESYVDDDHEFRPEGEESYKSSTTKPKKVRPSKATWYKDVDDAGDVKNVDPKMKVKFAKEAFEKRFAKTLELFEVKHISELDAEMTKLFMGLVQSESKSDEDYVERVYDKIKAKKQINTAKPQSELSPAQKAFRAEREARAKKLEDTLKTVKKELPTSKLGSGWSKHDSDSE